MIVTLVVVALACLAGLAVLRPFAGGRSGALHADVDPDEDLRRGLLRQLRDLDNDREAGKLTEDEHRALRVPVETEAVAVLRRIDRRVGSGELTTGLREIRPVAKPAPAPRRRRRLRLGIGVAAGLIVAGGVVALLTGTISPRQAGGTISGGVAAQQPVPAANGSADNAVAQAQAVVRQHPEDINAHLGLADAYLAASRPDQAAIEYLAVAQLQPNNPAANTGLALIAFQDGHPADAKSMLDKVLNA
ncbi:MAG TPA: tetratricopeptide repeat protein, partial [Pseudonocardiaceae bacterium]|nr:tetratricopeptide repeat protein [Pseudonocardiaceae bacterium]